MIVGQRVGYARVSTSGQGSWRSSPIVTVSFRRKTQAAKGSADQRLTLRKPPFEQYCSTYEGGYLFFHNGNYYLCKSADQLDLTLPKEKS